ncbi:ThiF family adenylyltransferase [Frankia sp. CiP3]|uniref:HesA/MoeB/ThiF family protein n=1 Tax=Frankia sp. CiP3 TaxID=2880971 RepID=UPI001EF68347|nr:ThiF family adenylyltransferase [Frankia sp. CiP3]
MSVSRHDRYARQRLIPDWDQDLLAAATAVIVGVGALGNEVAKNLALAGVGRLILCDPDTVAASNLSRAVLLGPGDVGQPKVAAAATALARLAPDVTVETRQAELVTGVGLGELADAGVVLGCLDSRRARLRLLGRTALVGAALVDGGTFAWGGEIRLRVDPAEACYGCSLTPHQRGESDLPWSCAEIRPDGPQPASIVPTSIVAGWMALAALRLLFAGPPEYRMLRIDGTTGHTAPVTLTRDAGCPHHRPLDGPVHLLPVDHRATVGDLLEALPAGAEPFTWAAFPVPGQCHHCGETYDHGAAQPGAQGEPEQQGQQGEPGRCRRCGRAVRVRRGERLRDADPGLRLHGLGVAPGEILAVQLPRAPAASDEETFPGTFQWHRLASTTGDAGRILASQLIFRAL